MKSPLESFSKFLYIGSREIYGVSVSHFWHIVIFYPLLMVSGLGHLKESFENEVGEKYKEFSRCKNFSLINRSKMR
jgi:hypothetical protein